jgi:hypothetical protein
MNNDKEQLRRQVRLHECAHAVACYKYNLRIDRLWVAPNFNSVAKGQNLGLCECARTDDHFADCVVSLCGEVADRILSGVRPSTEVCEPPWHYDSNGELRFAKGDASSGDRIDAHLSIAKLKQLQQREDDPSLGKLSDDLLLEAWKQACTLVRDNQDTICALAGFLSRQGDELSGPAVTLFLHERQKERDEHNRRVYEMAKKLFPAEFEKKARPQPEKPKPSYHQVRPYEGYFRDAPTCDPSFEPIIRTVELADGRVQRYWALKPRGT